MDQNQENSQSSSQDSSSSSEQRTQFLDSLGLGDDLLELTETRPERKAKTDDGLVLSSQPDDVELPGTEANGETVTSMLMTSTSRMYEDLTSELEKIDEKTSPEAEAANITVDTGKPESTTAEAPPLDPPVWMDEAPELPGLFYSVEDDLDEEMPPPLEPLPLPGNEAEIEESVSKGPEETPDSAEPTLELEEPKEETTMAPALSPEPVASITLPAPAPAPAPANTPTPEETPEVAKEATTELIAETPAEEASEPTPQASTPELSEPAVEAASEAPVSETITEPEPDSPRADSEEEEDDDVIALSCPSCQGELVLKKEHLGLEGACVWCQTPIVAAASGVDGGVRVFPLMTPTTTTPEAEQTPAEHAEAAEPAESTTDPVSLETAPAPIDSEIPAEEVAPVEEAPLVDEAPGALAEETPSPDSAKPIDEPIPVSKSEPEPEEVVESDIGTPSIELAALPTDPQQEEPAAPSPEATPVDEAPASVIEENASPLIDLAPLSPPAELPTEPAPAEEAEKPESVASKIVLPESLPTTREDVIPNLSQNIAPTEEPAIRDKVVAPEPEKETAESSLPKSSIDAPPSELPGKPLAEEPEAIVAASPFESATAPTPELAEDAAPTETPVETSTPTPWGKPEPQPALQDDAPAETVEPATLPSQEEAPPKADNSSLEDISSGYNTPTPWGKPADSETAPQSEPDIASIDEAPKTITEPVADTKPPVQVGDLTYVAEIEEIPEETVEKASEFPSEAAPQEASTSEPFAAASAFPAPAEKKSESAGSPIENQGFAIPAVTNSESVFGELEISEDTAQSSPATEEPTENVETPDEPVVEEKLPAPAMETPDQTATEEASHSVTSWGPPVSETPTAEPVSTPPESQFGSSLPEKREEEPTSFASSFAPPAQETTTGEGSMTSEKETPVSVPPLSDSPASPSVENAGAIASAPAGTPNVTSFSMSDSAPKKKKSSKSVVVLAVILTGFVFGGALATFVLPVDDYVKMAREYMEKKFETGSVLPPGITTETLGALETFQASGIEEN